MKNSLMTNIFNCEREYLVNFCSINNGPYTWKFSNIHLPDMYLHNFILIEVEFDGIERYINSEIEKAQRNHSSFLRIVTPFQLSNHTIKGLSFNPEEGAYDYMVINTRDFKLLHGNPDCQIERAVSSNIIDDGFLVDKQANQHLEWADFYQRRFERKKKVYEKFDQNFQFYVCYHNNAPIGKVESAFLDEFVKIEDFDILEKYQRKGFGTSVIKHLLKTANSMNINQAYLMTDGSDSAKEMYTKCGFEKAGEVWEYIFFLDK
ncbi:spore maturation protein CgeE [Paenibacillus uliginis N3/975]|uniref:Spore maturation protein CgeE n=1 Tax=Paenibacillus uliginis N3/975 TaxID=1313296 RepID=A0A1X7GZH0_9BACL|nr:GNAT family N-acetyltransferase [Paenibacillus uliginis]SMF76999.1 spore maturation protein CgeE [Paenibacillus uliginis N3/975]